tara:strand:+ start:2296 stop:2499 length:204 start_codon:yes stop_codon:yes gene_type:complete
MKIKFKDYIKNLKTSLFYSYLFAKAAFCSSVNAFIPFLFKKTANKISLRIVLEILNSKKERKNVVKK